MEPRVLLVGHCSADDAALTSIVKAAGAGQVDSVENIEAALDALKTNQYVLVLPNRVFEFTGEHGTDLIRRMRHDPSLADVTVMLVSNFADAQDSAVALGAVRGFGKRELGTSQVAERLKQVLAGTQTS